MPLASSAAYLNEGKTIIPGKLWSATAARKVAGTETRPLRSTLFTKVEKNKSTFSPNAHPWTLGKGRPIGTAEFPPIGNARPWVGMGYHGIIWASMVFLNKTSISFCCRHEFLKCSEKGRQTACKPGSVPPRGA